MSEAYLSYDKFSHTHTVNFTLLTLGQQQLVDSSYEYNPTHTGYSPTQYSPTHTQGWKKPF